jgi:hypothetical protein
MNLCVCSYVFPCVSLCVYGCWKRPSNLSVQAASYKDMITNTWQLKCSSNKQIFNKQNHDGYISLTTTSKPRALTPESHSRLTQYPLPHPMSSKTRSLVVCFLIASIAAVEGTLHDHSNATLCRTHVNAKAANLAIRMSSPLLQGNGAVFQSLSGGRMSEWKLDG